MIEIQLKPCCERCDYADIRLCAEQYDDKLQSHKLFCTHSSVCKQYIEDARYIKPVAIFPCEPTFDEYTDIIGVLSDIRAGFNVCNNAEYEKYHACTKAIRAIRELIGIAEIYDVD